MPRARPHAPVAARHVRRLVDFAEPRSDDTYLDVTSGVSELAAAIGPHVRDVSVANLANVPEGPFTLVTASLTPTPAADPVDLIRRLIDVCSGRLVVADIVRTRAGDSGRVERVRDPARTATRTPPELVELIQKADGRVRRLEVFTVERPVEPWVFGESRPAHGEPGTAPGGPASALTAELVAELDGGPRTGARPRLVGRELWFAQSWAYVAAEPVSRAGAARPRR